MLRHTITLLVLLLSLGFRATAQDDIPSFDFNVREETRTMERATANAFVLSWPRADLQTVSKVWKKYARGLGGKVSFNRRVNEYFVDNGQVDGLSENDVDITAKVTEVGEGTELALWFNMGVTYLNSSEYPERYLAAEKLLKDFDAFVYAELMREQLNAEGKQLREVEREVKKIEREQEREKRNIKKAERIIEKAQKQIDESEREIADYNKKLEEQKAIKERQSMLIDRMKAKIKEVR